MVAHYFLGDDGQIGSFNPDIAQPMREPQCLHQLPNDVACGSPGMAHRFADQRLSIRIQLFVPAHDRGQHDARRQAVGHTAVSAKRVSDGVARAHTDAGQRACHTNGHTGLALQSCG